MKKRGHHGGCSWLVDDPVVGWQELRTTQRNLQPIVRESLERHGGKCIIG
jgi:hypothetical protein